MSGPGSEPERLREYMRRISTFRVQNKIRSIVDIGCGDWAFSRHIDWGDTDYTGVDIVPELIDRLNAEFGSDKVRFVCADLVVDELPGAQLCLIKDVLQHLSNASVEQFLARLSSRFEMAIITNDIKREKPGNWRNLWRRTERPPTANNDTSDGGSRPLRLTEPPFELPAERICVFEQPIGKTVFTKEMLLWRRDGQPVEL